VFVGGGTIVYSLRGKAQLSKHSYTHGLLWLEGSCSCEHLNLQDG